MAERRYAATKKTTREKLIVFLLDALDATCAICYINLIEAVETPRLA